MEQVPVRQVEIHYLRLLVLTIEVYYNFHAGVIDLRGYSFFLGAT